MFPAERREVGQQVVRDILGLPQGSDRTLQVAGVPQDDRGDEQVEAGRPMLLVLIGAVTDFAGAMDEHGARQAVAGVALVEFLAGRATQFGIVNPMRRHNLASLRLDQHLQWLNGRRKPVSHIYLSASEMKNKQGMKWPLAEPTADLIKIYLKDYRPVMAAAGNPYLFPGSGLKGRSAYELAIGLSDRIGREIGLKVNLHLLRHFAAWVYLNRHPGAYELVRQVLGHKDIRVTVACYTGLETDAAVRHFDAVVLQDRAATRDVAQMAFHKRTKRNRRQS